MATAIKLPEWDLPRPQRPQLTVVRDAAAQARSRMVARWATGADGLHGVWARETY